MCSKRYILDSERSAAKDAENDVAIEDGWFEDERVEWDSIEEDRGAEAGIAHSGGISGDRFAGGRGGVDGGAGLFFVHTAGDAAADGAYLHLWDADCACGQGDL